MKNHSAQKKHRALQTALALLIPLLFSLNCATAQRSWFATLGTIDVAQTPLTPEICANQGLRFSPSRHVILGERAKRLWDWTRANLPDTFRVGSPPRIALVPHQTPGVALQAQLVREKVAFIIIQSHAKSIRAAAPFSKQAVASFLDASTGCSSFRLCSAKANIDEVHFRGHTTCERITVPIQLTTAQHSRNIVSVATWLPSFTSSIHASSQFLGPQNPL